MSTIWAWIALAAAGLFGFILCLLDVHRVGNRLTFASEFLTRFLRLTKAWSSGSFEKEDYVWLTQRVSQVQDDMGSFGLASYRPPFANYMIHNYLIIPNTLSEMRTGEAHENTVFFCQDALLRYSGALEKLVRQARRQLLNPFVWYRETARFLVTLPLRVAVWLGLAEYPFLRRIAGSWPVRALAALAALLGLLASVMTVVLGWERFSAMVRNWVTVLF